MQKTKGSLLVRVLSCILVAILVLPSGLASILKAADVSDQGTITLALTTGDILAAIDRWETSTEQDLEEYVLVKAAPDTVVLSEDGTLLGVIPEESAAFSQTFRLDPALAAVVDDIQLPYGNENSVVMKKALLEAVEGKWLVRYYDAETLGVENCQALLVVDPETEELLVFFINNGADEVTFALEVTDGYGATVSVGELSAIIQKAVRQSLTPEELAAYQTRADVAEVEVMGSTVVVADGGPNGEESQPPAAEDADAALPADEDPAGTEKEPSEEPDATPGEDGDDNSTEPVAGVLNALGGLARVSAGIVGTTGADLPETDDEQEPPTGSGASDSVNIVGLEEEETSSDNDQFTAPAGSMFTGGFVVALGNEGPGTARYNANWDYLDKAMGNALDPAAEGFAATQYARVYTLQGLYDTLRLAGLTYIEFGNDIDNSSTSGNYRDMEIRNKSGIFTLNGRGFQYLDHNSTDTSTFEIMGGTGDGNANLTKVVFQDMNMPSGRTIYGLFENRLSTLKEIELDGLYYNGAQVGYCLSGSPDIVFNGTNKPISINLTTIAGSAEELIQNGGIVYFTGDVAISRANNGASNYMFTGVNGFVVGQRPSAPGSTTMISDAETYLTVTSAKSACGFTSASVPLTIADSATFVYSSTTSASFSSGSFTNVTIGKKATLDITTTGNVGGITGTLSVATGGLFAVKASTMGSIGAISMDSESEIDMTLSSTQGTVGTFTIGKDAEFSVSTGGSTSAGTGTITSLIIAEGGTYYANVGGRPGTISTLTVGKNATFDVKGTGNFSQVTYGNLTIEEGAIFRFASQNRTNSTIPLVLSNDVNINNPAELLLYNSGTGNVVAFTTNKSFTFTGENLSYWSTSNSNVKATVPADLASLGTPDVNWETSVTDATYTVVGTRTGTTGNFSSAAFTDGAANGYKKSGSNYTVQTLVNGFSSAGYRVVSTTGAFSDKVDYAMRVWVLNYTTGDYELLQMDGVTNPVPGKAIPGLNFVPGYATFGEYVPVPGQTGITFQVSSDPSQNIFDVYYYAPRAGVNLGQMTGTKTAERVSDDVWKITLDITGGSTDYFEGLIDLDIVLVIDRSGSMNATRMSQTKAAAIAMIDSLSKSDNLTGNVRVGVVSFSSNVTTVAELTTIKFGDIVYQDAIASLTTKINGITASGTTYMDLGFASALTMLGAAQPQSPNRAIVLMGDGANSNTNSNTNCYTYRDQFVGSGGILITVGLDLGDRDSGTIFLKALGGSNYYGATSSSIVSVFQQIAADIVRYSSIKSGTLVDPMGTGFALVPGKDGVPEAFNPLTDVEVSGGTLSYSVVNGVQMLTVVFEEGTTSARVSYYVKLLDPASATENMATNGETKLTYVDASDDKQKEIDFTVPTVNYTSMILNVSVTGPVGMPAPSGYPASYRGPIGVSGSADELIFDGPPVIEDYMIRNVIYNGTTYASFEEFAQVNGVTEAGGKYILPAVEGTYSLTYIYKKSVTEFGDLLQSAANVSKTYDGLAHGLVVVPRTDLGNGAVTVKYSLDGGVTYTSDTSPTITNVGSITVYYQATYPGYNPYEGTATVAITPKAVTITPSAASKAYGDSDPAFTGTVSPALVKAGDLGTITYARKAGDTGQNAGDSVTIVVAGYTANANYTVSTGTAKLTINPKGGTELSDLLQSADNVSAAYDGQAHGLVVVPRTDLAGGAVTVKYSLDGGATYTSDTSPTITNVADGPITVYYEASHINHNAYYGSATVTITPKAVTITPSAASKTYGDSDPTFTGTVSPALVKAGDLGTITYARKAGDTGQNAGDSVTIVVAGYTANNNYAVSTGTAKLTINPKGGTELSDLLQSAGNVSAVYDGQAHGLVVVPRTDLAGGAVTVKYSLDGGATYTSDTSPTITNVGDAPGGTITVYYKASHTNHNPYYGTATVTITPKAVTITPSAASKAYGDSDPAFTGTVSPALVAANDLGTITYARKAGDTGQNAGDSVTIVVAGYTANANYTVSTGTAKLTINPKGGTELSDLLQSAGNVSAVYDGQAHGLVVVPRTDLAGDAVTVKYSLDGGTTYTSDTSPTITNVGDAPGGTITVYYKASHTNHNPYYGTATVTITPKAVTITPSAASKTYGDSDPAFTGTVSPALVKADDLGTITYARKAGDTGQNAGDSVTIVVAGYTANANYTVSTGTAKLTINPKGGTELSDLLQSAGNVSAVYDGQAHGLVVVPRTDLAGGAVTVKYSATGAPGTYTLSTSPAITNVADGPITVYYEASHINHNPYYGSATVTITRRVTVITPTAASKTYGDSDPAFTGTVSPALVAAGDLGTISYVRKTGDTGQNAGDSVTIVVQYTANNNYAVSTGTAKLTINPKGGTELSDLLQSAANVSAVYDGQAHGLVVVPRTDLAGGAVTVKYSATGAPGTYTLAVSPAITNVADGPITVYYEASHINYSPYYGTATVTITAKAVTITPNAASKFYNDSDPPFSGTVSGLVGSDSLAPITYARRTGDTGQNAGDDITIVVASYKANSNYTVSTGTAKLTINPKQNTELDDLLQFAGNASAVYDGDAHGLVVVPRTDLAGGAVTVKYSATGAPGTYTLDVSPTITNVGDAPGGTITVYYEASHGNFNAYYGSATVTITPKAVTITPSAASKTYGDGDPAFTGTVSPALVDADDLGTITYAREAGDTGQNAGDDITIVVSGYTANANYTVSTGTAKLTINPKSIDLAQLGVQVKDGTKVYGDADPEFGVENWPAEYDITWFDISYVRVQTGEDVGTYEVTANVTLNPTAPNNFVLGGTASPGTLTITKRQAYITPDTQIYEFTGNGGLVPALTAKLSNFVGGDAALVSYTLNRVPGLGIGAYPVTVTLHNASALTNYDITLGTGYHLIFANTPEIPPVVIVPGGEEEDDNNGGGEIEPEPIVVIPEPPIPLAPDADKANGGQWSLINLILAAIAALISLTLLATTFKKNEDGERHPESGLAWRIIAILAGAGAAVAFLLTETIVGNEMTWFDKWSIMMGAILLVQIITALIMKRARSADLDE